MSKVIIFTAVAVTAAAAVAIASLVINIIILTNTSSIKTNQQAPPTIQYGGGNCAQPVQPPSTNAGWKAAANYLLDGLDTSVDPCQDFYAFTCNKFLGKTKLNGMPRLGTYDQSQTIVNGVIAAALNNVDYNNKSISRTERITKKALDSCVMNMNLAAPLDLSAPIYKEIQGWFGGVPFLNQKLNASIDLFSIAGTIEQTHAVGTLMFSWSSVDYKNISRNALYISQPDLALPRDYYVKPQFITKLNDHSADVMATMKQFAADVGVAVTDDSLTVAAQNVVNFEVQIATASWPDEMMRNYLLQYNQYFLAQLSTSYPQINWNTYLKALFDQIPNTPALGTDSVVLSQPSYFAWLDAIFNSNGQQIPKETIANYIIVQLLMDDAGFLGAGSRFKDIVMKSDYVPYMMRRGRGVTRIGRRQNRRFDNDPELSNICLDIIMAYMPYGPGYVYVKAQDNRDKVVADVTNQTNLIIKNFQAMVQTLTWMSDPTKALSANKSASLVKNYGWPTSFFGDFKNNFKDVDNYNVDYNDILDKYDVSDFYNITKVLKRGMEVREAFRLLGQPGDRSNFLQSPAMVNAWYQPERNSITFPYAAWNPPYYNFDYPQAYNFAGQGGTGGHELTHGFDDEGVQFNWDGSMTTCTWNECGWMDAGSQSGFTDMAQCVVSQFSTQCCPQKTGNVHCVNGATTQGENIADLGGQQAAYNAYREYIQNLGHEEDPLPGMSQFTPNQVFWITYGYSWCMKQSPESLTNQLLTNPHSPAQCRTNQVMQDIPQFGKDFNCKQGSPMFPMPADRCMVWVGY